MWNPWLLLHCIFYWIEANLKGVFWAPKFWHLNWYTGLKKKPKYVTVIYQIDFLFPLGHELEQEFIFGRNLFWQFFTKTTKSTKFSILKVVKIHFHVIPPHFGPFLSVKHLNFGEKLPIQATLERRHSEVTKKPPM